MSMERKPWRLPTPFRRFSGNQDLRVKSHGGQSRNRVSSVYLSDSISINGFIVVPEFDDSVRTQTIHEASNHASHPSNPSAVTPSSPLSSSDASSCLYDLESIALHYGPYPGGGPNYTSVSNANRDDDLSQRLGFAYEHIRSMPSAVSRSVLSMDPQILRQQLGVPQHSVFNHPIHSSPDLPNPHTFPPEPTSPKSPPTTPPDVSHASPSRKLGLRIKTRVYPKFPRRDFQDSFEPASIEPLTENSPPQCHTLEGPWSAENARALRRQPSNSKRSKFLKRRAEKPIITSSLTFSRPRAMRGALQKQAANTSRSTNAHRLQTSLPQVRPPSPFQVDIPLHHTWHDPRTNFNSSPVCHSKMVQFRETSSRRTREDTEVLASLAWIGTPPTSLSSHTADRRRQMENPVFSPDQLSMAIAVEDDSISDDALIDRLERVRRIGHPPERAREVSPLRSLDNAHCHCAGDENGLLHSPSSPPTPDQLAKSRDVFLPSPLPTQNAILDSEDTEVWRAAKKALLCVREIVRTEKKYQEAIRLLLNAQTVTPPPPSMVPYISALVRVSETLLKCYLEDPSAWGVSTAFVASEDELEATMVSWCAVAGVFFMDGNDPRSSGLMGKWRLRKSGGISSPSSSVSQHPQTDQERQSTPLHKLDQPPSRKLSIRDVAIQPIQRVMRYVLLYRDLLECTPSTSPSRLLVERALEAATRIANHCDRAQRNPAFFHAS